MGSRQFGCRTAPGEPDVRSGVSIDRRKNADAIVAAALMDGSAASLKVIRFAFAVLDNERFARFVSIWINAVCRPDRYAGADRLRLTSQRDYGAEV